jgi:hypothetical protein
MEFSDVMSFLMAVALSVKCLGMLPNNVECEVPGVEAHGVECEVPGHAAQ